MARWRRWGLVVIALLQVTWWRCLRVQPMDWLCGGPGALHPTSSQRGGRCQREARRRGAGGPPPVIVGEEPATAESGRSADNGQAGGSADGEAVAKPWKELRDAYGRYKKDKHWPTLPKKKKSVHSPFVRKKFMRQVAGCKTLKDMKLCMSSGIDEWPPAALALAWRLVVKMGGKRPGPEIYKTQGRLAEELRQRSLYQFEAVDLATIVYSWGVSKYSESGKVLRSLLEHVVERLEEQSPRGLANMVYAMGCLGNRGRIAEDLLGGVCSLMVPKLAECKPQEIANTVWGMSKLLYLAPGFLRDVSEHVTWDLHKFKAQEIANLVLAMQRLGYRHPDLMRAVCEEVPDRLDEFSPLQLANLIYALGRLQVKHSRFTIAMSQHVGKRLPELQRAKQLINIEMGLEALQSL